MSTCIHKSRSVSALLYHAVCPTKYRRVVSDAEVNTVLRETCWEIADRYEIVFLLMQMIKSITAKEIFRRAPSVKTKLWVGALWERGDRSPLRARSGCGERLQAYSL